MRRSARFAQLLATLSLGGLVTLTPACKPGGNAPPPGSAAAAEQEKQQIMEDSGLPETVDQPLPGDTLGVTIHRLSNGMTVYISTDKEKPRFTAWIGVRAGSRHDPADSTGLAHYLEHMLFKGTDEYGTLDAKAEAPHVENVRKLYADLRGTDDPAKRKEILKKIDSETQEQAKYAVPNEISRMYSNLGVESTNAFTSDEQTVYIGDFPTNRFEAWARVESERFSDPVFRLFYPELEAVYEEKNLSMDRPWSRLFETLALALWPEHPYGTQPTIGIVEHLKTPAYQDMSDFFDRWYLPNNMAIVLAGDIDATTALPILEKYFSRLEPKKLEAPAPGKVVPLQARVEREVVAEGEESTWLAWQTVPVAHEDEPVFDVLDRVLDDAKVGLINVELELTQKVPSAGSFTSHNNEAGYFGMRARARQDQKPEDLEKLLVGVIQKLKKGDFTQADIDAAVLHHTYEKKLGEEFAFARASEMMDAFISRREWKDVVAREKRLASVTREDIIRVANKYLGDKYVVVFRRKGKFEPPKIEKPQITPIKIDPSRRSPFAKEIEGMKTLDLEPEWLVEGNHYAHRKLAAGDLIAARNKRNDLFSISYSVKRGYRKDALLCHALDLFEVSGSGSLSAEQLQKKLYALGASVSTNCGGETASITLSGIDSKMPEAQAVLDAWLADPTVDGEAVKRLLTNTISERRDDLESEWTVTAAAQSFAKYGKQSSYLQRPSNKKLEKATAKQLIGRVKVFLNWEHRTMYFGPRDPDAVAKLVARGEKHKKTGDTLKRKYRKAKKPKVYFLHKDKAKATVEFIMPRKPLARDSRPAARVFSEYLSGSMSALVFQEIREARGLAYSAYSHYSVGSRPSDESALRGYISTQADKTPDALETFLGLLRSKDIQPDRFANAKVALDQEYRSSRVQARFITWRVRSWDELQEKTDPRPWEQESVGKLSLEEAKQFSEQFADAPVIISIVGNRDRVGLDAIGKIAPVTELKPEKLFSYGKFPAVKKNDKPPKVVRPPKPPAKAKGGPAASPK